MKYLSYSIILPLLFGLVVSDTGSSIDYSQQGKNWNGTCATGTRQSPIDFPSSPTSLKSTNAANLVLTDEIAVMVSYDELYNATV